MSSQIASEKAHDVSRIAMWDTLVDHYFNAYDIALEHTSERREEPREFVTFVETTGQLLRKPHQVPVWKDIYVQSDVPGKLSFLNELANNLWWSWNSAAEDLFRSMDPSLWDEVNHNPKALLEKSITRGSLYLKMMTNL
jgi:glycogen phosphorylase/synthase